VGGVVAVGILAWTMLSDPGGHGIETDAPTEQLVLFDANVPCPASGASALYAADQDAEAPAPEPTPAVGVTGAPARPVRLPSQDSPDSTTSEAPQ